MVSESRQTQVRDRRRGNRCSFDVLFQTCLIIALLLIIGCVIFNAYTARMELNRTHQLQHKSDKRIKNLERRVKGLTLPADKELKLNPRMNQQAIQQGVRKNKSVVSQNPAENKKPTVYGIFYPKRRSYETDGRSVMVMWEACAGRQKKCPRPERKGKITFASKSSFRIARGGIFHFTCQLILNKKKGITYEGLNTSKTMVQIMSRHGNSRRVVLSLVQNTDKKIFHLSGLGNITSNSLVSVRILPYGNSKTSFKEIFVDRSVPAGSFFNLFLVD